MLPRFMSIKSAQQKLSNMKNKMDAKGRITTKEDVEKKREEQGKYHAKANEAWN